MLSSSYKYEVNNYKNFELFLEKKGYRITNTIGCGSYAKVKEAEYTSPIGQKVKIAVKIIDRSKAPSDFLMKFLPRELDIYTKLHHLNIIKVYEIIDTGTKVYIFMELAEGGDLLDFIKKRGALGNNVAKRIFLELASAINYCHSIQITHRDLKCENILLDRNFHVKLADFGFGRSCADSETGKRLLSRTFCGSTAYAAPEILQGNPYNPKLYDIWSLGCVLFIMLCGSMPFEDSDIKKMIKVQLEGKIKYPSRMIDKIDPMAKDLISQMLQPDITKRANIEKVLKHPWLNC